MNSYLSVWLAALLAIHMNTVLPAAAAAGAGAGKQGGPGGPAVEYDEEKNLQELFKAIDKHDKNEVQRILAQGGFNINGSRYRQAPPFRKITITPLGAATLNGDFAIVELLLHQPDIDIELGSSIGTPLIGAALKALRSEKYLPIVKLLLDRGANPKNGGIHPVTKKKLDSDDDIQNFEDIAKDGPALQKIYDEFLAQRKKKEALAKKA